ncbi:unnamed protein product [Pleuronectes platessa]|uniref:Uncharacterized protein n=1 Tax=Pleuronectes platessa TaxID=8262 RepID=A0A9N7US96_PLEPL|nr:unnamed protein product [Pleuronectes platessa]
MESTERTCVLQGSSRWMQHLYHTQHLHLLLRAPPGGCSFSSDLTQQLHLLLRAPGGCSFSSCLRQQLHLLLSDRGPHMRSEISLLLPEATAKAASTRSLEEEVELLCEVTVDAASTWRSPEEELHVTLRRIQLNADVLSCIELLETQAGLEPLAAGGDKTPSSTCPDVLSAADQLQLPDPVQRNLLPLLAEGLKSGSPGAGQTVAFIFLGRLNANRNQYPVPPSKFRGNLFHGLDEGNKGEEVVERVSTACSANQLKCQSAAAGSSSTSPIPLSRCFLFAASCRERDGEKHTDNQKGGEEEIRRRRRRREVQADLSTVDLMWVVAELRPPQARAAQMEEEAQMRR